MLFFYKLIRRRNEWGPSWGEHTMGVIKAIGYSDQETQNFREVKTI